jgi:hypothetical protein
METWTVSRQEEMPFVEGNKLFSGPTSCDLGLFAICMFFRKRKGNRDPLRE